MPTHTLTRVMPYSPAQMCDLVGDVERYPEFIRWITSMRTWDVQACADGGDQLDAEATVGFSMIKESFSTRVRRNPVTNVVTVSLLSGPFKRLVNEWKFLPHPDGCQIEFMIDYEFKSAILGMMLEANFDKAVNRLVWFFQKRARELYGTPALDPT